MKTVNPTIIKHVLAAAFAAMVLNGCDGEGAKSVAEVVDPAKPAEVKTEGPVVKPAPVAPASVKPVPQPVSQAPASIPPKPAIVLSNDVSGLLNIAKGKVARQSGHNSSSSGADLAVDGNVDGAYPHGSTTHTNADPNAWLDIDLGNREKLDHIVLWNRTDCCGDRLENYWIFISDKPFSAADTADKLKKTKGVKAIRGGVANPAFTTETALGEGRYLRIQLDGTERPPEQRYLSLAEVEVYRAK